VDPLPYVSEVADAIKLIVWCDIRTDNTSKVRFSATLGEEPDVELVWAPCMRASWHLTSAP
jgi:hypothetical protein